MGNRLQKQDSVSGTENCSYNAANMLLTRGANNYANDADGNTLTGGGRTNTWDSQNRMVQCVNGANTSSFVYGSDGIRRQSTVNGATMDFVLDNSMFVRERNHVTGANVATYLMGGRGPEYRRDDTTGQVRWYVYDGLGSVLGEVDPNGNITSSRKYDVYGLVRGGNNPAGTSSHKFVGQLGHPSEDNTGLIYMRARYYDASAGRFTSEDSSLHGDNWFEYASSNPINQVDPSGKSDFYIVNLLNEMMMITNYALDLRFGWDVARALPALQRAIRVLRALANISKIAGEAEIASAGADLGECAEGGANSADIGIQIAVIKTGLGAETLATRDAALLAIQAINCMIAMLPQD